MSHQFAPVAPLPALRALAEFGLLGHYQLLIAPIVLDRGREYKEFFDAHPDQLVILDNGVIEQGYPLDPVELWAAARTCRADVVVLPDTIDDGRYTAKQAKHALDAFYKLGAMGEDPRTGKRLRLMGVVQGKTLEECIECAKNHVETGVDWLAVPRGLTPNLGTRVGLTVALAEAFGLPIHILGLSDNIADDIETAVCHQLVRGIDFATATWLSMTGKEWGYRLPLHPPAADSGISQAWGRRPEGFWQAAADDFRQPVLGHNIETVRRWLRDAKTARTERAELAGQTDQPTPSSSSSEKPPVEKSSEPTDPS